MDHPRYVQRTVEWGHWGITFMDIQPDRTKNFGNIIGTIHFAVSTRGPIDAGEVRQSYLNMCSDWINNGILPNNIQK